ncbi:MAG: hypothetical protein KatS3mg110_3959 [Pirellulaceae bacterium]|nr:MAG: hypothetical protein KatS3mg110_3959 [Pirellulaceae bacterium]
MLLLDEAVWHEPERLVARRTFSAEEFFLQGHFPGDPVVPGVILCECALQAGAVLAALRHPGLLCDSRPVVTRLQQVRFKRMVRPDECVEAEVQLTDKAADAYYMHGRLRVLQTVAATLEFACMMTQRSTS